MTDYEKELIKDLKGHHWRNSVLAAINILGHTAIARPVQRELENSEFGDPKGFEVYDDYWRAQAIWQMGKAFMVFALLRIVKRTNQDYSELVAALSRHDDEIKELLEKAWDEAEAKIPGVDLIQ